MSQAQQDPNAAVPIRLLSREEAEREDRVFWHSKTPMERWAAAEQLRQIAYGYDPAARISPIIKRLHSKSVEYLLVGGYAVIHHGYVRTTGDMDIWTT